MKQSILKTIESKPSKALRAILDGLARLELRSDWVTDFGTFGSFRDGICHGCLATAALQELSCLDFDETNIEHAFLRADATGFCRSEVFHFEKAIDDVRGGKLERLFTFCNLSQTNVYNFERELPLDLNKVAQAIDRLEANGL